MAIELPTIGAVILCGGRSRRMGRDKAWVDAGGGRPLLQEVVARIAGVIPTGQIVVAARGDQSLPALAADVRRVFDDEIDQGPMAGVVKGLSELSGIVETTFVLAADSPRFEIGLIELLRTRIAARDAAVPRLGDQLYPLTALYRTAPAAERAREFYAEGGRRVINWAGSLDRVFVDETELRDVDATLASFAPCNTPEELSELS